MSAVMVAPMDTMVACGPMMTDDARAVHGQHPVAPSSSDKGGIDGGIIVIIGIVVRVVVVIDAADKNSAEVTPMAKGAAGKSGRSRNSSSSRADRTAANGSAAKAATKARTAAATASTTTTTAMSAAADFDRPSIGNGLADCSHPRIDRRQRVGTLAGNGRDDQQRRSRAQHAQRTPREN